MKTILLKLSDAPWMSQLMQKTQQESWSLEACEVSISSLHHLSLKLVSEEGHPLGCIVGTLIRGDAEILCFGIEPAFQGKGKGRFLLRAFERQVFLSGGKNIFIDVRADNTQAKNLYRSTHYKDIGIRKKYYNYSVDAIQMKKNI